MTTKKPKQGYVPGQTMLRDTSVWDDFSDEVYGDDGYDNDLYNADGTLRQGSLFDDSYDYERTYSKTGAASSWWRNKFSSTYDYPSYSYGSNHDPMEALTRKLGKELKEISRTVNAVRNTLGAKNREKNLKVAWAGTQTGRRYNHRASSNNTTNQPTIYLSPDPLTSNDKIKPDWTEDQKRDALIGEALTLTSMKRTVQPVNVKKIQEVAAQDEVIRDLPLLERSEQEKTKLRVIAREIWKSMETYKAQAELLQDYRGCRAYFAAYLAFYSDKGYREKLAEELEGDDISSIKAAAALAWNVNHMNVPNEQLLPPEGEVEDVMLDAFDVVMEAVNYRSTFQRWEAAVQAAEILRQLDQDDEDKDDEKNGEELHDEIKEWLYQPGNGNSENLFGDEIENVSGVQGKEEVEQDESMGYEDAQKSFQDASKNTTFYDDVSRELMMGDNAYRYGLHTDLNVLAHFSESERKAFYDKTLSFSHPDPRSRDWDEVIPWVLAHYREKNRRMLRILRDQLEPNARNMVLPEYGMRSGRVTGTALWKVPTSLPDNDRVFHRKIAQGETKQVTIGMLIDYSGSMNGASIQTTRRIALLIHDLLLHFPQVNMEFFGHEVSGYNNSVMRFRSIEEVFAKGIGGGTNEGTALARTGMEFLQSSYRKDRKLLLVIGDGCSGEHEIEKAVNIMSRTGIELYDILIDGNVERATQFYGRGKVVGVHSYFDPRFGNPLPEHTKTLLENAGYDHETPQEDILELQFLSILRPWLAKVLRQLHDMGGI